MYKIRKISLYIITIIYLILSIIEFIKYLFMDSNMFGLIYLVINIVIIFLLIPTVYNYKNNYSKIRFSKFMIIVFLGLFISYILRYLVVGFMNYSDSSLIYINSISIIKNVLKPIIYLGLLLIGLRDIKLYKTFFDTKIKKNID